MTTITDSGITFIETMIVMLLIGIAATLAQPSIRTLMVESKLDGAALWIVGDIRYTQSLAIRTQRVHSVDFDPVNKEYRVVDQSLALVQHPLTRRNYHVVFGQREALQGIDLLSATFGGSDDLVFDAMGGIQDGGNVILQYAGRQRNIAVSFPTGRVTVQ